MKMILAKILRNICEIITITNLYAGGMEVSDRVEIFR